MCLNTHNIFYIKPNRAYEILYCEGRSRERQKDGQGRMRGKLILRNWLMELWGLASLCFAELVGQVEIPVGANVIVLILEAI